MDQEVVLLATGPGAGRVPGKLGKRAGDGGNHLPDSIEVSSSRYLVPPEPHQGRVVGIDLLLGLGVPVSHDAGE